jgi:hypothetical protein
MMVECICMQVCYCAQEKDIRDAKGKKNGKREKERESWTNEEERNVPEL